jgi:muramoyltetrapeptide carboxypeptidase
VPDYRTPRPLVPGDRVAVVAPSGPVDPDRLAVGVDLLRSWDLAVDVLPGVSTVHERLTYLAGDDQTRAKDFRGAWLDASYAAVICARGGYGVQRLLPHLDFAELTAAEPKWFVGFSDITALHEPLNAAGIVTLHGPMAAAVGQLEDPPSRERLRQLLFGEPVADLLAPGTATTMVGGSATGPLRGGNVAMLAASIGTPTYAAPDGGIVVLEDISEDAYRLDRLLTQLLRAGWFDRVAGIVLGDFSESDAPALVDFLLADRLAGLGVPTVRGAALGHEPRNLAIPLGAPATLNADQATLSPA